MHELKCIVYYEQHCLEVYTSGTSMQSNMMNLHLLMTSIPELHDRSFGQMSITHTITSLSILALRSFLNVMYLFPCKCTSCRQILHWLEEGLLSFETCGPTGYGTPCIFWDPNLGLL